MSTEMAFAMCLKQAADVTACNYIDAWWMTDSEYPEPFLDCFGVCLSDVDGDGVCDELEVDGCTFITACNFNPLATEEDGSCLALDECGECGGDGLLGCVDPGACNFDVDATCSDGTCEYETCAGCTDEMACNYDGTATDEDGSCCMTMPWDLRWRLHSGRRQRRHL